MNSLAAEVKPLASAYWSASFWPGLLRGLLAVEGTKTVVSCMLQTPVTTVPASAGFQQAWTALCFLFFFLVRTMNKTPSYFLFVYN